MRKAIGWIERAARAGASIVCLPEYWYTGTPKKGMSSEVVYKMAETTSGPLISTLAKAAADNGIYIAAGSIIANHAGKIYNTSFLLDPKGGIAGHYSKTHPENAPVKYELGSGITPGGEYQVFDTSFAKLGIMIDTDAVAPEVPRILAAKGAQLIFWPLNWSVRWATMVDALSKSHAIVNRCYVVASNRVGRSETAFGEYLYNGGSRIIDPEGTVISMAPDFHEGMAIATVDPELVRIWREDIIPRDYPKRRRPETYAELLR
jgi:predicted amidohydrolase